MCNISRRVSVRPTYPDVNESVRQRTARLDVYDGELEMHGDSWSILGQIRSESFVCNVVGTCSKVGRSEAISE